MKQAIVIAGAVIAAVLIVWAIWPSPEQELPMPPDPAEQVPAESAPPQPMPQPAVPDVTRTPEEPEVVVPPLQESDEFVRERLEPLDLPEAWVAQGDYARRLAVVAENASRGTYPRRQLGFLAPSGAFKVTQEDDRKYVDPASYDRYDQYVEQLEGVAPAQLAGLLDTMDPLVSEALAEIGVDAPPDQVFVTAMREVMRVPVLDGEVELVQPNVMYEYADPELESLTALQKQVLRMGPENVRRLKAYVERLATEMNLTL